MYSPPSKIKKFHAHQTCIDNPGPGAHMVLITAPEDETWKVLYFRWSGIVGFEIPQMFLMDCAFHLTAIIHHASRNEQSKQGMRNGTFFAPPQRRDTILKSGALLFFLMSFRFSYDSRENNVLGYGTFFLSAPSLY